MSSETKDIIINNTINNVTASDSSKPTSIDSNKKPKKKKKKYKDLMNELMSPTNDNKSTDNKNKIYGLGYGEFKKIDKI